MKAIVILLDSVNRHFLGLYGQALAHTPNIDRLAKKSVIFDNHWAGSLPCMPARRDLFTGRLNFLERNWGPMEPFDHSLGEALREHGVYSHMVTDHYHYFRTGGENYVQQFDTYAFVRGQELDPWVSKVSRPESAAAFIGKRHPQYELNRTAFHSEADFPSPKTLKQAAEWLESNKDEDRFLLWAEAFDPHEPFDLPQERLHPILHSYSGPEYMWPEYGVVDVPDQALAHIRSRYSALLEMADHWVGKLLDVLDRHNLWEDTTVIFTSDHGYLLGEHSFFAKNYMPVYNEIARLPLTVHLPGGAHAGTRIQALTQSVDLYPTLLESFGIDPQRSCRNRLHGKSLLPLINGQSDKLRDELIYGYFGKNVNITDGQWVYFRSAGEADNRPLHVYTAMPTTLGHALGPSHIEDLKAIEAGAFLSWTEYPVYRIPGHVIRTNDRTQSFLHTGDLIKAHRLFDLSADPCQNNQLFDEDAEKQMIYKLISCMHRHDAPEEQFARLGLQARL
ncbi:sulfatase [Paenibacillus thalictri]|uniref:Sulfatase n=1 Tax=Paenibacillus thalictri TaxID=2527873 RepID=A0A4Q9DDM7_9BACL|nr:sulfatase [Paenibacillus thalictri]TBL69285.1 sulfatase [Paenibacillus thalictri]